MTSRGFNKGLTDEEISKTWFDTDSLTQEI